jgi:oligopeptide transport system ATP-binding protein
MTEPVLSVRDLKVEFPTRRGTLTAIDGVSFDIAPGEILGVVGESGSGKTTLGKTLLGAYRPTSGQILYRGQDLATLPPRRWGRLRRDLQMVFQDPLSSFNPRFTIKSSLALPLRLHGMCTKDRIADEVASLLRRVGLGAEHGARYPHELSGGQLQRVAIARAISVEPRIIVADEAVSKLDVSVRAQVLNLLKRMNRETGVSLLFITHDLGVARFLCDRIAVMYFGRIVEIGTTDQVFGAPRHPYTLSLLRARGAAVATDADETGVHVVDPAQACNYAARCARRIAPCTTSRPGLAPAGAVHAAACFVPVSDETSPLRSARPRDPPAHEASAGGHLSPPKLSAKAESGDPESQTPALVALDSRLRGNERD